MVQRPNLYCQICGCLEMYNFNICVVHLGIGVILDIPKFGAIHVGSPYCVALTAHT